MKRGTQFMELEVKSWPTLRALLQDDLLLGRAAKDEELNKLKSDYLKLSPSTAKKLLDFWKEQKASQA